MKINGKNVSEFKIPFTKKEIHDFFITQINWFLILFCQQYTPALLCSKKHNKEE